MHDVEENVFEDFHAWLYTHQLTSEDNKPLELINIVDLWVFGDRFQVPMLQNCAMDEIFIKEQRGDAFPLIVIKAAYEKTMVGSLLRRALIEILAFEFDLGDDDTSVMSVDCHQFWTVEMLADLVKKLDFARKHKIPHNRVPKRDKCFFHVHGKDEHC